MERNNILAPSQKGFRPFDGTLENNFVFDRLIAKATRIKSDLFAILLDLRDAFGSVPHEAIFYSFQAARVGKMYGDILEDLYEDNFTTLLTSLGLSDEIAVKLGVKQGCPLSGPVFNLIINPIFLAIQNGKAQLHGLGYADDTAVIENTIRELQETLNRIINFLNKLGL